MEYKYIQDFSPSINNQLIRNGWRRFGEYFSRPVCQDCNKCLSIRIDAFAYKLSKSARRTIRKNEKTKIYMQTPSVSMEHVELYCKYHKAQNLKKGWEYLNVGYSSYYDLYVSGANEYTKEVLYVLDDRLIGVDLIDITDDGISSIYFYYDPDYSHLGLGRYSMYQQIYYARLNNLRWIYIGYYVKECESLNYKADYKPYEVLQNEPELGEFALWSDSDQTYESLHVKKG